MRRAYLQMKYNDHNFSVHDGLLRHTLWLPSHFSPALSLATGFNQRSSCTSVTLCNEWSIATNKVVMATSLFSVKLTVGACVQMQECLVPFFSGSYMWIQWSKLCYKKVNKQVEGKIKNFMQIFQQKFNPLFSIQCSQGTIRD